jgi:hypothetical protein
MPVRENLVLLLTQRDNRQAFGGVKALVGILLETLLSALIAPVMMIFQSTAVGEILLGRDSGWQVQRRDDGGGMDVSRNPWPSARNPARICDLGEFAPGRAICESRGNSAAACAASSK